MCIHLSFIHLWGCKRDGGQAGLVQPRFMQARPKLCDSSQAGNLTQRPKPGPESDLLGI